MNTYITNVGSEPIFVKFKYTNKESFTNYHWFDCKLPLDGVTNYEDLEVKIEPSFYHGMWDGCKL